MRRLRLHWESGRIHRHTGSTCLIRRPPGRPPLTPCASGAAQELDSFASTAGIAREKVEVASFSGERGLAAARDVAPLEPLVTVPLRSLLVAHPLQRCPFPKFCDSKIWSDSTWDFKLAVQLVYERRRGTSSHLHGYIANLPQTFDLPVTWSDQELEDLQYPFLVDMVRRQREDWHGMHDGLAQWQQQNCPDQAVSWEEMLWGLQACRSRAFGGPFPGSTWRTRARLAAILAVAALTSTTLLHVPLDQAANGCFAALLFNLLYDALLSRSVEWHTMCPMIDLMNHRTGIKSDVQYQWFSDSMEAICDQPFSQGDEVLMSYGDQSNDSLLQFYGFVEADCSCDCYTLTGFVPKARKAAEAAGLATRADVPDDLTIDARMLRSGASDDLNLLVKGLLKEPSTSACAQVLQAVCSEEQSAFASTLKQDEQRLRKAGAKLSARAKTMLAFQIEKKTVLSACLESLGQLQTPVAA